MGVVALAIAGGAFPSGVSSLAVLAARAALGVRVNRGRLHAPSRMAREPPFAALRPELGAGRRRLPDAESLVALGWAVIVSLSSRGRW